MGAFLDDTAPTGDPAGPDGRFVGRLGDDWSVVYAFGGATLAATLRAMDAAIDRAEHRIVAAHAQFLSPVRPGPFTVDVEASRLGRSVAQITAELRERDGDKAGLRVSGTWAQPRADDPVHGRGIEPPSVARPGSPGLLRLTHDPPWDQFPIQAKFEEWRSADHFHPGALFITGLPPEAVVWARLTDDCRHPDGRFELAALALAADRAPGPHLGPCMAATPEHDLPPRPLVTLEMTLRIYAEPVTDWLLLHSRVDQAANGHVATRVDIWDEDDCLVASSEQLARYASSALPT